MRTKRLGNSELELTVVGLGTWAIGGPWEFGWGPQDDDDSIAAIYEALECGINWIDTAPMYGFGHSEEMIGRVLKDSSIKPLVATKFGLVWDERRIKLNCLDKASIVRECEDSLRRLGVEVIDLYQMHWPDPDEQIEEAWEVMSELTRAGKIRYAGVSNVTVGQMERLNKIHPVTSLQPPYNMLRRGAEDELLGYCGENNIGVVAYGPMAKGFLTGKFDAEKIAQLPEDDVRHLDDIFSEPKLSANLKLVDGLREIANLSGRTVAQIAIAWVLRRQEVTAAIVGARRPGQIVETAKAGDIVLSDDEVAEIEALLG